jgi:vacuolar protein sorting-associated protein 13A/C
VNSIPRSVIAQCIYDISGAQQEGVEGFFKGVGKGLMGLMTKPAGGVLDCIAMAMDGIKR